MYQIEKNVPMPENAKTNFMALVRSMEIGDSVVLSPADRNKVSPYASHCGVKLKTKTIDGVLRMWRIA
jgi:hypothetical protein